MSDPLSLDDYRAEIKSSREYVAKCEADGTAWVSLYLYDAAIDTADELLAEVERLRAEQ